MARLRRVERLPAADAGEVPDALKDHDSPVWRHPHLFREWCADHELLVAPRPDPADPLLAEYAYHRFDAGLKAWAQGHGYMRVDQPNAVDYERLQPLGVSRINSLNRFRLRSIELPPKRGA